MRHFCLGSFLLFTAISSSAVTLGRYSGAGIIGRPLDIRVEALLSPGEDLANLCVNADVLYGEAKVAPEAVRTSAQRSSPDTQPSVRIQASVPINEPIVTVVVRAGCSTPFTRRYVLLADPASESARSSSPEGAAAQRPLAPAASALPTVAQTAGKPLPGVQPPERAHSAERAARPARPASVVRKPVAPSVNTTPRLELDAMDLSLAIERDPVLKLTLSLLSEPTTSEETRAAAGLLWKAINASPEDVLRDARKLEVLEAESKGLREAEARNQATIAELSSRVEQSQHWQWLVYLLGALLLLAALGLLWLWRHQKQLRSGAEDAAWWAQEAASKAALREPAMRRPVVVAPPLGGIDLDLSDESGPGELRPLTGSHQLNDDLLSGQSSRLGGYVASGVERRDFLPSQLASRSVAAEELFDVQQQADFFLSLGEDEQAIQVLRNHIQESQVPSALAYLDLFKTFHRLGRRADYEALRTDFNQVFNADAPPFDQYADGGRGLEAYETAFGRIQALWPEPKVLEVIEESIFRESADNEEETEVFDLEAYRELLLLHALAKDINQHQSPDLVDANDFQSTKVQRLQASGKLVASSVGGAVTQPMDMRPSASPHLGLDVNLDELAEFSAFEASLPEVAAPVSPTSPLKPPRDANDRDEAGNLIDFEVLDFTSSGEEEQKAQKAKKGKKDGAGDAKG